MVITSLENISTDQITCAFNEAFQDYIVKVQLTNEGMEAKMRSEGIRKDYSFGAFEDGKLTGFILHGYQNIKGRKIIYNAGTGVSPSFRGKSITKSLYKYCIPLLAKEDIYDHVLEVIETNHPAINIYKEIGFKIKRKLLVYKKTNAVLQKKNFTIRTMQQLPTELNQFAEMEAAWQNSILSIERDLENHPRQDR